jgi:hypothetical protein
VRTYEFIAALTADPVPEPIRLGRRVAAALVIGLVGSVALYAFALPTLLLTLRLARPDAKPRALALWLAAPFILLAAGGQRAVFDHRHA